MFYKLYFRIHDAFVAKINQKTFLNIIFEKCDWDLQEFLREIPSDMPDGQCKHFAKQVFILNKNFNYTFNILIFESSQVSVNLINYLYCFIS